MLLKMKERTAVCRFMIGGRIAPGRSDVKKERGHQDSQDVERGGVVVVAEMKKRLEI